MNIFCIAITLSDELSEDAANFCTVDPTKMLLQNVNREFLGNYSCRGFNAAGWGDESESDYLDVYYEPGNATVSHFPLIPVKTKSMVLSCAVEYSGNPESKSFHWLRNQEPVADIFTSQLTIGTIKTHLFNILMFYSKLSYAQIFRNLTAIITTRALHLTKVAMELQQRFKLMFKGIM